MTTTEVAAASVSSGCPTASLAPLRAMAQLTLRDTDADSHNARPAPTTDEPKKQRIKSIHDDEPEDDDDDDMDEATRRQKQRGLALFDAVFSEWPSTRGKHISRRARDARQLTASALVYGEITYPSLFKTLVKIRDEFGGLRNEDQVFYDLGSGAGKPVVAAAAAFASSFKACRGIELLEDLVTASLEAKRRYDSLTVSPHSTSASSQDEEEDEPRSAPPAVSFHHADVTDLAAYDWSDGDVVFANSTCFDDGLMLTLARAAESLKVGAFFVTLTKRLPSDRFLVCDSALYQMSWGGATVFIHRKVE